MNEQNYFIGSYVNETRDVVIAGILANQNIMLLGAPGYGKTAIARDLTERIAGENWSFSRLDPSTPVETVAGAYDPAELLNGRLIRVVEGTPYQPGNRVAILDEMFRASEPMFDKLLDVCDRKDVANGDAATVIGTANFVESGERVEALIDRFGLWYWVETNGINAESIVGVHLRTAGKPITPGDLPNWETVERVRSFIPDDATIAVVGKFVANIAETAMVEGRRPHPRRLAQWSAIVYRVSAFEHDSPTFNRVSPMAARIMRYAFPNTSREMAAEWEMIVAATVDPIGGAIDEIMADAVTEFRNVGMLRNDLRTAALVDLGSFNIAKQQSLRELATQYGDDDRIKTAIQNLTSWFGMAASGIVEGIG